MHRLEARTTMTSLWRVRIARSDVIRDEKVVPKRWRFCDEARPSKRSDTRRFDGKVRKAAVTQ